MGDVKEMIESVLPVQLNLPQRKEKPLEVQPKEEQTSFSEKMNEKSVEKPKRSTIEKSEQPKEMKAKSYEIEKSKFVKKESLVSKEENEEDKPIEELLLAISEQMLGIEQLRAQPESLYQYIQKIQTIYETYGNIKLNELPATELQSLMGFLKENNIQNTICLEDTIGMALEKLTTPENMTDFAKIIQSETCDLMKKEQEPIATISKHEVEKTSELGDTDVQLPTGETNAKPFLVGNDSVVKQDMSAQKVSLPDLGKKMEAHVEALQKFVVKQERVLFQLNPEKLGTLTVYMKKQGDQIQVHIEMDKHDAKKKVEIIFDELKNKLKEKDIQIELSYTDKDQKREQQERGQQYKQKQVVVKKEQKAEQDFAGLLEE
ncbi:flagellar hook-length control protein FliK [Bacillus sp. WLY-B-L8]|uniref:flagellar hook-length control protein FliK n=1 Tax=Bacillus multifaciens TaxID=3068506 RepID=UPI002741360B|nr:flagellar hook-length control protein FliK [Bacillus sp. WLY-B-L8]MDP7980728.1 flagellar hook-length control protein FliK [Bacillus sp. WLY-B-L8]